MNPSTPNMRLVLALLVSLKSSPKTQASVAQGGAVPITGVLQDDNSWAAKKYSHKFRSLTESEMNKVASRTNEALLRSFVDNIMIPRVPDTDGHRRVAAFIANTMRDLGWTISKDSFRMKTPFGEKPFENIVATLPLRGSASSSSGSSASILPPRRLAIACHYDSKYYEDNANFVAATDSAVPW